jgi:hypothetical protein
LTAVGRAVRRYAQRDSTWLERDVLLDRELEFGVSERSSHAMDRAAREAIAGAPRIYEEQSDEVFCLDWEKLMDYLHGFDCDESFVGVLDGYPFLRMRQLDVVKGENDCVQKKINCKKIPDL